MSNYRKAVRRRAHSERLPVAAAPPAASAALLEKHSDYVRRARAHHRREAELQRLRTAARLRNPDEFSHRMERAGEGGGGGRGGPHHAVQRRQTAEAAGRSAVTLRRMKEQDYAHLTDCRQRERTRIARDRQELALLAARLQPEQQTEGREEAAGEGGRGGGGGGAAEAEADSEAEAPATRSRLLFTHSSPAGVEALQPGGLPAPPPPAAAVRLQSAACAALLSRLSRAAAVEAELRRVSLQRLLMGKGRRRLWQAKDEFGEAVEGSGRLQWKQERRR